MYLRGRKILPFTLTLFMSSVIVYSVMSWQPWIFILAITCYLLFLIYLILRRISLGLIIFGIMFICLWLRLFPYLESLPLGVDPIRDVIFAYAVSRHGHFHNVYVPRFVDYYQYFPSTQIIPLINSMVSGLEITLSHYLTLSFILSLSTISILLITRSYKRIGELAFFAAIFYATIPTILVWNYWVIPMALAITFMCYSLLTFISFLDIRKTIHLVLSLLFSVLTIMTHAGVGIILLGFYVITLIVYVIRIQVSRYSIKPIVLYNIVLHAYTFIYWQLTGFLNKYLLRYISYSYNNFIEALNDILQFKIRPSTPSLITTPSIKFPSKPVEPGFTFKVVDCLPTIYPGYYLLPRWIWSSLLILLPLLLFIICKLKNTSINDNKFALSLNIYSIALSLLIPIALSLRLIWKAERYLASPATIFIIITIVALSSLILKSNTKLKLKAIISSLLILLAISSIFDPRVAYYVNPIEGDRVTFKLSERAAADYLLTNAESGNIITDYNLMTMYIYYLIMVKNKSNIKILFGRVDRLLNDKTMYSSNWIFLFRTYSAKSYYIWNLNYKYNPQIINKALYYGNIVYTNRHAFIALKS